MRVNVDKTQCVLSGNCEMTAERVFRIQAGELEVEETPEQEDHDAVREAAMYCPTQAITVEED
jgi:ferredoxin